MPDHQGWVTYASNDLEGLKALVLARSLKQSITRRLLTIFISTDVSENIWKLLQVEFDSCIKILKSDYETEFPKQKFRLVAQTLCCTLKRYRKFVFLDCNCLVIKNSDELFKKFGLGTVETVKEGKVTSVIAASPSMFTYLIEGLKSKSNEMSPKTKSLDQLDEKYFKQVNLMSAFPLAGQEIKIVHFLDFHPLDLIVQHKQNVISEMGQFQQVMVKLCLDLLNVETIPRQIQNNGTTFEASVKLAQGLFNNTSSAITKLPNQQVLEDLKDSVAIVGMSFRLPGANTIDEFWDLLINGKDGIIRVPEGRWNKDQCFIRGDNTKDTQAGFLKCPIDMIDGKFFALNAAELATMDPQQKLSLQVVWEALENAGVSGTGLKETQTGVFGGWWRNDYKEILQEAGLNEADFFRAYMGNALGTLTGRISHFLELTGPSISTESGCSTSIVAVDMACNSLLEEKCDMALAVGVNLLIHPFSIESMTEVIAIDGHCKTFDAKADGFGRAEGCAVLVLKRFADAAADGDNIWGVIRGSAVVQEGVSRSLGTPTVQCEALAMQLALERAGVEPKDVSFVETHGTGTPVGDPLEFAAVAKVYSQGRTDVLTIGSVKTNIGHTESVSGIAGIVKTVLSLQNEMIPQHLNLETLNPDINLDVIPAQIPLSPIEWKKVENKPRIAGVSSFGITGTDAHVIIQETPDTLRISSGISESLPLKCLTISAKSPEGLEEYIETYKNYLTTTTDRLEDIEFSMHLAREHFSHRASVFGSSKEEIIQKFEKNAIIKNIVSSGTTSKLCFLFTGQGSQYPGMAQNLYKNSLVFKSNFDYCDKILNSEYGLSIKETIWGDANDLKRTLFSQTSIFCIEYCLLKLWESWGVKPNCVLGHSLGEFAAAVSAGILSFKEALKLVVTRSKLIDALPQGKMLVIKEDRSTVESLMKKAFEGSDKWLDIAAVNTPEQTVLAGKENAAMVFADYCDKLGMKTHILDATHAFHSRQMEPVLTSYESTCKTISYKKQKIEFVSGMDGKILKEGEINANYWVRHTREKVNFLEASKVALESGCTHFLEIGPQPVLSAMILINSDIADITTSVTCLPSIRRKENEWDTMMTSLSKLYLSGVDINWNNYHRYSSGKKVNIPSYPFQEKSYWIEMKDNGTIPFHPLVGCAVPNPTALKIYSSNINLHRTPFLRDHVLGTKVIFPGAGFMEMCLAAGHAAIQCTEENYTKPTSALTIENFAIEAPLLMNEQEPTKLQVVVSSEESGETKVAIYSKLTLDKDTHKWIKHATAQFSPFASKWDGEETFLKDSLENIKIRCNEEITTNELSYSKLDDMGLKFGPTFQTIEQAWKKDGELLVQVKVTDDPKRYVCHPVMTDSIFQAMMGLIKPDGRKLQVPIAISKYIWLGNITDKTCYVYCTKSDKDGVTAVLMNSDGSLVTVMVGAEFMETTVGNVMSLIESQRQPLPNMLEDVWREQLGPFEKRKEIHQNETDDIRESYGQAIKVAQTSGKFNKLTDEEKTFFHDINKVIGFHMVKALNDLGLEPEIGQILDVNALVKEFGIIDDLKRLFFYILMELAREEHYFEILDETPNNMKLKVVKGFPIKSEISTQISELTTSLRKTDPVDINAVTTTTVHLANILTGKQSALALLFPENSSTPGAAETYYYQSKIHNACSVLSEQIFPGIIEQLKATRKGMNSKTIIRILEIGAGTGSFTSMILPHFLNDGPAHYEYTYTDISPAFFSKGEKLFENSKMKVHFKVLNIEEDAASQGFIPHNYDMIIASYVIHATRNIEESMANTRNLLSPGGVLIVTELNKPFRVTNMIFGVLSGFWKFEDSHLRENNCEIDVEKWGKVLSKLEYENYSHAEFFNRYACFFTAEASYNTPVYLSSHLSLPQKSWIVFSDGETVSEYFINKLMEMGRRIVVAKQKNNARFSNPKGADLYEIQHDNPLDVLKVFEAVGNEKDLEGILFLWGLDCKAKDNNFTEVLQPFLFICQILYNKDLPIKLLVLTKGSNSIDNSIVGLPTTSPVISMAKSLQNENQSLVVKCIDMDPNPSAAHVFEETFSELFPVDGEVNIAYRNNQRLIKRCIPWKPINTALKFPNSKYFDLKLPSSLALSDLRFGPCSIPPLADIEVEVQVKAYSLNFRDILAVMKPDPVFDNLNTVGIDYSGYVTAVGSKVTKFKVGDAVFGINLKGGAMPSHAHVHEDLVIEVPESMTLCDVATLPAVAATAYVCLYEIAKLTAKDTILIHTASGGVGLAAIQIAMNIKGARIVVTAGSDRKRQYLRNLGIKYIFNSRNTNYGTEIREALGGKGVDVVLNSLTGEGFKEASLSVCNENARFIEMSKMNVWSVEEVKTLRPDVQYDIIDLSADSHEKMTKNTEEIKSLLKKNTLEPIPYVRFDAAEIREAMAYLQKAKHIGKIICVMPETVSGSSEVTTPLFNDRSSYMITGGLGGIGMEVAKWMANSGAKHIILVGRNPPKEKTAQEIKKLNSRNLNVVFMKCDVGDREQCAGLLNEIKSSGLPPLRGIMHAAGVLSDAFYHNQTWEKFEATFNPKVRGGWNLHELTLNYQLEHFVMFSSIASMLGSVAQSNHGAANYFLDSLAHYRNSIGLPAITINWGQWGGVGVAADLELVGIRPFTPLQGVSVLEKVLRCQKTQIAVLEAEFQIIRKHLPCAKRYFEELKSTNTGNQLNLGIDADKFWKEYDSAETRAEKYEILRKNISHLIKVTLKMEEDEVIDDHANFQDLGMDSLMMIEMKNGLQASVGKRVKITVNAVRDCKTVAQLATRVVELISGVEELPVPSREELVELIKEDSLLSEDIKVEEPCKIKPSQIKTVLITGVTGNLGPYMLREICKKPEIDKVYCVIRNNRLFSPKDRLKQILTDKKLLSDINFEKVECISGDVTKPMLGMAEATYDELAEKVDGIFHLSVKALLQEYYCKSEHVSHSRTINVFGTKNVLKFACCKKTKHVYHASTLLANFVADEHGSLSENWPLEGGLDDRPNSAYYLSKMICDRLMDQANQREIPCKAFRFPLISGDSKLGGNVSILDNHVIMRMMAYMYLGIMPARNIPLQIIPVDVCAELSTKMFFNDEIPLDIFNFSNPFVEDEMLLEDIAEEFGYKVKVVEPEEFIETVNKLEGKHSSEILDMVKTAIARQSDIDEFQKNVPVFITNWLAGEKSAFLSRKLVKWVPEYPKCLQPTWVYLKKDLMVAKEAGVFAKIGLK